MRPTVAALLLLLSALASGCASAERLAEPAMVTIEVDNDLSPSETLLISIVPPFGRERILGRVARGTTAEFYFEVTTTGPHRLRATRLTSPAEARNRPGGGAQAAVSDRFSIAEETERVRWSLRVNRLEVR